MARRNQIDYYPQAVRDAIDAELKKGGQTLDELLVQIRHAHTEALAADGKEPPSRSALGRYAKEFEDEIKDMRETRDIAKAWVNQIGTPADGDVGAVLVEMLQSLSVKTLMAQKSAGTIDLKALCSFAVAAQRLASADQTQVQRAKVIRDEARKELMQEQKQTLAQLEKRGMSPADLLAEIKKSYGV